MACSYYIVLQSDWSHNSLVVTNQGCSVYCTQLCEVYNITLFYTGCRAHSETARALSLSIVVLNSRD